MKQRQKMLIFLNYFGVGLFIPILNLFILAHGCNLQSLAVVMGVYSTTVILSEVPSGMYADMFGRKNAYYLACVFIACSFTIMYLAKNVPCLIIGMILFGLGKAFSTGSLDSLIVEDCLMRNGEKLLSKTTSQYLVFQCAGIAVGSLVSGFIPDYKKYFLHIVVRVMVLAAVTTLCVFSLSEKRITKEREHILRKHIGNVGATLKGKALLRVVLLCIVGMSGTVFSLEMYWQPHFTTMIEPNQQYLLGVVSAGAYGGNMFGSILAGKWNLSKQSSRWHCYFLFVVLSGVSLILVTLQTRTIGFVVCYILVQIMVGIANVPEQTLLNSFATEKNRASLISIASLFSQMAGIVSSTVCASLVLQIKITGIWILMGGFTIIIVIISSILFHINQLKEKTA